MRRTTVYIVCSPRPAVGKTLIARVLTEFLLLQRGAVSAFDINLREPSLLNYLPPHHRNSLHQRHLWTDGADGPADHQ